MVYKLTQHQEEQIAAIRRLVYDLPDELQREFYTQMIADMRETLAKLRKRK